MNIEEIDSETLAAELKRRGFVVINSQKEVDAKINYKLEQLKEEYQESITEINMFQASIGDFRDHGHPGTLTLSEINQAYPGTYPDIENVDSDK